MKFGIGGCPQKVIGRIWSDIIHILHETEMQLYDFSGNRIFPQRIFFGHKYGSWEDPHSKDGILISIYVQYC
jgi:hypothetical protein